MYCLCPQCSSKSPDGQLLLLLLLLLLFSFMLVTSEHSHLLYLFLQSLVYNTTGNFDISAFGCVESIVLLLSFVFYHTVSKF